MFWNRWKRSRHRNSNCAKPGSISNPLNVPEHIPDLPGFFSGDIQWIEWTLRQIEKDFMLQGLSFSFSEKIYSRDKIVHALADFLRSGNLISGQKLPGLLYQMDISEKEIANLSLNTGNSTWAETLAEIILFRCFTKVYWRKKMK